MSVLTIGDGPHAVLALHGIQGTRDAWLAVAERLAARARFILPNLRGRGAAPRGRAADDYALDAYAADVEQVVASTLNGRPFTLAGWSMGVSVALAYVARARGPQPQRLVLLSGTPKLCAARWFHGDGAVLMAEIAARQARLGLHRAADHEAVALTWQSIRRTDQRPMLGGIAQPVLVLHGRDDEDSPWDHAVELAAALPHSRFITIEKAGHGLLAAHAVRVADEIQAFIEQDGNHDAS